MSAPSPAKLPFSMTGTISAHDVQSIAKRISRKGQK